MSAYNFHNFINEFAVKLLNRMLPQEARYNYNDRRISDFIDQHELYINFELGILFTLLNRDLFLKPISAFLFPDINSNSEINYEIKSWPVTRKINDYPCQFDFLIFNEKRFLGNLELKHKRISIDKADFNQLYQHCYYIISEKLKKDGYSSTGYSILSWERLIDKKQFTNSTNCGYYILNDEYKCKIVKGILEKDLNKYPEDEIEKWVNTDSIKLFTWESFLDKCTEIKNIYNDFDLSHKNIMEGITEFISNMKRRKAIIFNEELPQ